MADERNKAVVRRYFEEFHNQREVTIAEQILGSDLLEPTKRVAAMWRTAFPDYHMTIEAMVGEGDIVATVWTARGTHLGEWMSPMGPVAATGKSLTWTGTTTLRIADGQIVAVVGSNHDHLGILQQMGALPAVSPRPGA